jgi:hypothetical protein
MGNNTINYSRPVSEAKEGETPIYHSSLLKEGEELISNLFGEITDLKTLYQNSFNSFKDNPFLGTREKYSETVRDEETKKEKTVDKFGKYMYLTFGQVEEYSVGLARSIINKDLCPKKDMDDHLLRVLGIYSKNREEWALTDIA